MKTIVLNNKTFTILRDDKRSTHYCVLYKHNKKYDLDACYTSYSKEKRDSYNKIVKDNTSRGVKSHLYIICRTIYGYTTGHIEIDDDGTKWLIINTKNNVYAMVYPFND